jgi:hypothetical protein
VLTTTDGLDDFVEKVDVERQNQLLQWGDQSHPDGTGIADDVWRAAQARNLCNSLINRGQVTWRDIMHEEACEVIAERDQNKLERELIQLAAVCAAWYYDIQRRKREVVE